MSGKTLLGLGQKILKDLNTMLTSSPGSLDTLSALCLVQLFAICSHVWWIEHNHVKKLLLGLTISGSRIDRLKQVTLDQSSLILSSISIVLLLRLLLTVIMLKKSPGSLERLRVDIGAPERRQLADGGIRLGALLLDLPPDALVRCENDAAAHAMSVRKQRLSVC